jgi:hypothetical protein
MQQRSIPKCPGLNRVSTNNYHWTVPNGTTASKATYCENCTKKFRIAGNQHRTLSGCNCDSYRLSNKANNGIFNISFWEPSLFSLYETLLAEDSTYYVKIPSGKKFSVLLQSDIKATQTFRYEIDFTNSGTEETYSLQKESPIFVHDSTFVGTDTKKHNFGYVDSQNPGWDLLNGPDRVSQYKIVKPGDSLVVKIHIYDTIEHDFMTDSGRNLGDFTLTSEKTIKTKKLSTSTRQQTYYDSKIKLSLPSHDFERFTKTPIQMRFIFITDTTVPDTSDKMLDVALSKMIICTTARLNSIKARTSVVAEQERTIHKSLHGLKDEYGQCNSRLSQLQSFMSQTKDATRSSPVPDSEYYDMDAEDSDSDSDSDLTHT